VDQLRPIQDWSPPYDVKAAGSAKAASIRGAIEAVSADLGFSDEDVIPTSLDAKRGVYNVDTIWSAISERIPDAQRAQLVRALRAFDNQFDWRRLRTQAVNAGRILAKAVLSEVRPN
jgi:hypothetical protein